MSLHELEAAVYGLFLKEGHLSENTGGKMKCSLRIFVSTHSLAKISVHETNVASQSLFPKDEYIYENGG